MFEFLQGGEIVILILVAILLIWGPTKLPQLARGIGKALYEFKKASKGLIEEEEEKKEEKISDEQLEEIARKLGVDTRGKSRSQIMEEVVREARRRKIIEN